MIDYSSPDFWPRLGEQLLAGTWETVYMVGIATLVTILVGAPIGILVIGTRRDGFLPSPFGSRALGVAIHQVLSFIVNLGRSVPFIILMIALIPVTRWLVGTFVGTTASIVPLSIVAIPFFARMVELSLADVDPGLTEAARSLGAGPLLLVRRVLLGEALPSIVLGLATTITSIVNFSAMVGTVGGGGLGNVAITYGWQRYSPLHILFVIVILFVLVQLIQALLTALAKRLSHV